MPYTVKNPPDWLKNLPKGAIKIGVEVFNAALAKDDDEDKARQAAWGAIKNKYEKGDDGTWRAKQDVSLSDIERTIREALESRDKEAWLRDVYGSYIIYEKDGKFFKLAYSILDGEVQFASDAKEVETVWVEARSQQAEQEVDDGIKILLRLDQAQDAEGTAWDVTICEPGFTKNGWYIPDDALRDAAGLFENVDVNLYELPQDATHVPDALFDIKSLLVKNKVGWIDNVKHVAGKGLKGVLHFLDSAKWLGKNLLDAMSSGKKVYGLSYDAPVRAKKEVIEDRPVFKLLKFLAADSVDIVTRPAAGGKFNRAVAAQKQKEGDVMNKKQLWEMIQKARPDLLKGKEFDSISDEEVIELARMAMEPAEPQGAGSRGQGEGDPGAGGNEPQAVTKDDLAKFRCEMALKEKLAASELPEIAKKRIQITFEGRVFEETDLDKAIGEEKDYLAKMAQAGGQTGDDIPGDDIRVGIGTLERAQMAADKLFDLDKEDVETLARMETLQHEPFFTERLGPGGFHVRSTQDVQDYNDVPAFRSLREMYTFFTGDHRVTGYFDRKKLPPDLRSRMDITSATFTYVLGNTLGRRLVKVYRAADYLEGLLVSVKKSVTDFRTQEAVLVGGFPDLADVDPEAADYEEIASVTDEESTYSIGQKGNILTITRKTIINDDITIVQRLINAIGRAARRTHGQYVWDMYIDNDNCTDGTAVFTSGHGNLGAAALTHATALISWKALAAMTEKDSGKYLGLLDGADVVVNLIGPPALKELIGRIEKEEFYYSTNDLTTKLPNPLFGEVKGHTLSLLSGDANDWFMLLPPEIVELIEMGYLNGRQEPEMFVADSPQSEQVFVADKIRHKIRHEYAGTPIDYRGGYKGAVA